MILNYLLSLTLLIMSVIKVTDLFIHTNKTLDAKRMEFIRQTKKTHQDGSITLMGALLTVMMSALLMFFAYKFKMELSEARYRKDSYLCFNHLNIITENYISDMAKLNVALRIAYAAKAIKAGAIAHPPLLIAKNMRHLYFLKTLMGSTYCKSKTAIRSYLFNQPYKTTGLAILSANIDGTTIVRKNKWKVTYYQPPERMRLKKSFCLQADLEMEGSFIPNFKIKTKELPMGVFSKLKCSAGFL